MLSEISGAIHSTPIRQVFHEIGNCETIEEYEIVQRLPEYFTKSRHHAAVITRRGNPVGIITLRDLVHIMCNPDNLGMPIKEFMSAPLQMFEASSTIGQILETLENTFYNKIVVTDNAALIGIVDKRHLLSMCYTRLKPVFVNEYNMIHSLMELVGEGERGLLKMATTDTLTGIGNRRLFEEIFAAQQKVDSYQDITFFLLLFDIDNFKSINDTFGHNVGDSVLRQLAELISRSIRKTDIFVRWGGEEFAILLRYSDSTAVLKVAEQIRKRIDEYSFETIVHVTCSFGLTAFDTHESLDTVFNRADQALYRAKAAGKNCVRIEMREA